MCISLWLMEASDTKVVSVVKRHIGNWGKETSMPQLQADIESSEVHTWSAMEIEQ